MAAEGKELSIGGNIKLSKILKILKKKPLKSNI